MNRVTRRIAVAGAAAVAVAGMSMAGAGAAFADAPVGSWSTTVHSHTHTVTDVDHRANWSHTVDADDYAPAPASDDWGMHSDYGHTNYGWGHEDEGGINQIGLLNLGLGL